MPGEGGEVEEPAGGGVQGVEEEGRVRGGMKVLCNVFFFQNFKTSTPPVSEPTKSSICKKRLFFFQNLESIHPTA